MNSRPYIYCAPTLETPRKDVEMAVRKVRSKGQDRNSKVIYDRDRRARAENSKANDPPKGQRAEITECTQHMTIT